MRRSGAISCQNTWNRTCTPPACDRSIFVQTQHDLQRIAGYSAWRSGTISWSALSAGWTWPAQIASEQLLEFKDHPKFVGVRHVTQDEPDDDFIVSEPVLRGLAVLEKHGVPFDLLFYVKHLRHVPLLARRFPELRMVIDHLAKPCIKDHNTDDWLPHFKAAAGFPNVYCKLSGMVTEADWQRWTVADLRPYVQTALECFGPRALHVRLRLAGL